MLFINSKFPSMMIYKTNDRVVVLKWHIGRRLVLFLLLSFITVSVISVSYYSSFYKRRLAFWLVAISFILLPLGSLFSTRLIIFNIKEKYALRGFQLFGIPFVMRLDVSNNSKIRISSAEKLAFKIFSLGSVANLPIPVPLCQVWLITKDQSILIDESSYANKMQELANHLSCKLRIDIE